MESHTAGGAHGWSARDGPPPALRTPDDTTVGDCMPPFVIDKRGAGFPRSLVVAGCRKYFLHRRVSAARSKFPAILEWVRIPLAPLRNEQSSNKSAYTSRVIDALACPNIRCNALTVIRPSADPGPQPFQGL
jgi:hypothetical protein